jgi:hypothetical protein
MERICLTTGKTTAENSALGMETARLHALPFSNPKPISSAFDVCHRSTRSSAAAGRPLVIEVEQQRPDQSDNGITVVEDHDDDPALTAILIG